MNKKILCLCMVAVGIIALATITSAVGFQSIEKEKKESPLFRIRTNLAISQKLNEIKEKIKSKFIINKLNSNIMPDIIYEDFSLRNNLFIKHTYEYPFCSFVPCMQPNSEDNMLGTMGQPATDCSPCK